MSGLSTGKYNERDLSDTRVSLKGYEWLRECFRGEESERRLAVRQLAADLSANLPRLTLARQVMEQIEGVPQNRPT